MPNSGTSEGGEPGIRLVRMPDVQMTPGQRERAIDALRALLRHAQERAERWTSPRPNRTRPRCEADVR
jgi:hypothetical protein